MRWESAGPEELGKDPSVCLGCRLGQGTHAPAGAHRVSRGRTVQCLFSFYLISVQCRWRVWLHLSWVCKCDCCSSPEGLLRVLEPAVKLLGVWALGPETWRYYEMLQPSSLAMYNLFSWRRKLRKVGSNRERGEGDQRGVSSLQCCAFPLQTTGCRGCLSVCPSRAQAVWAEGLRATWMAAQRLICH